MADNTKYLKVLEKTYKGNLPIVENNVRLFKIAMIAAMGGNKKYGVGPDVWESLGKPTAQYVNNDTIEGYFIDLGDPKTLGELLAFACHSAIQAGCFAATDISDAINAINNDNLDGILNDREAMVATSQVMIAGMNAYRDLQKRSNDSIGNPGT